MRDRTIFAHAVLEFGGCRWVGRQPPCVREDRKMESKGGVYLALDFIIRYPSKGVFDIWDAVQAAASAGFRTGQRMPSPSADRK